MRNVITIIAALVVLAVVAGAVVIYSGAYYVGADKPHWSITTWLLKQARDRSIRVHASGIAVPASLDDRAKILAGVSHYAEHCAVCHGAPGVQRGDMAEGLYPQPPNLADAARAYSPGELFWIVKHGIRMTGMLSWGEPFRQRTMGDDFIPPRACRNVARGLCQAHRGQPSDREAALPFPWTSPSLTKR